jgi:hypothetical protein
MVAAGSGGKSKLLTGTFGRFTTTAGDEETRFGSVITTTVQSISSSYTTTQTHEHNEQYT